MKKSALFIFFFAMISIKAQAACTSEAIRAIDAKQTSLGTLLGNPTVAHFETPVGAGCGRHYERGSIYFRPCVGAFEVHGLIRNLWASKGWETSSLGFPMSDEVISGPVGRVSVFQGGAIYYHPTFGTRMLNSDFLRLYIDRGGPAILGFPKSDMSCDRRIEVCSQIFENGTITKKVGQESNVDLRADIARKRIAIRDQAGRNTCSVHTITFLLEYAYTTICHATNYRDLSEEYLNHMTNVATKRTDDGDFFHNIIKGYNTYGIVKESDAPFMATYDYNTYQVPYTTMIDGIKLIRSKILPIRFLKEFGSPMGLSTTEFNAILSSLSHGVPVGLGRSHSMVIVGYRKDVNQPGGGVFIFRNSYGTDEGTGGYVEEDFENVIRTANDAVVVDHAIQ